MKRNQGAESLQNTYFVNLTTKNTSRTLQTPDGDKHENKFLSYHNNYYIRDKRKIMGNKQEKEKYVSINLRKPTVDRLRKIKIAKAYSTGQMESYSDIIEELADNLRVTDPALHDMAENVTAE